MSNGFYCCKLLISSPQVKTFMILTHININPELLIKPVVSKLRMSQKHMGHLPALGKYSASLGRGRVGSTW